MARPVALAALWALALGSQAGLVHATAPGQAQGDRPERTAGREVPSQTGGRLGGSATVHDDGPNAFGFPAPVLDAHERRAFAVGNALFKQNWVTAPASTAGRDGLGPLFNARSCSSCHLRDGRGQPGETSADGLLVRVGVAGPGADLPHPLLGGQIQDAAVASLEPEAAVAVAWEALPAAFPDGAPYELVRPSWSIELPGGEPLGEEVRVGGRLAPQMIGLGLLEAIPAEALLARADPDDLDGDGISGRAHQVRDARTGAAALGRFGWKATQPTVEQQVAAAFANDLGITSSLFPSETLSAVQDATLEYASGGAPELDDHKLGRVTFYSQVLAVPARRGVDDPGVARGEALFERLGCAACHVPSWTTGPSAVLPEYAGQTIHPYTDLLLHDMGPGLADGKRDGRAGGSEWRTPPLWGIGLIEAVNGHTRYLHDGRARNLLEAVLWHGGEAEASRQRFRALPAGERAELLAFLGSL